MTTYTPNIFSKPIRCWDNAAKKKKGRKKTERKEVRVFNQEWSQDGWTLAKVLFFCNCLDRDEVKVSKNAKKNEANKELRHNDGDGYENVT